MRSFLKHIHLISVIYAVPNNIGNECTGSIEFFDNYRERFGEPHPVFYVGSLEDAIREACHKPAREVIKLH